MVQIPIWNGAAGIELERCVSRGVVGWVEVLTGTRLHNSRLAIYHWIWISCIRCWEGPDLRREMVHEFPI
jgi:hypothetical protein